MISRRANMRITLATLLLCSLLIPVSADNTRKRKDQHHNQKQGAESKQPDGSFPTTAKAGECYVQVRRPAKYRTQTERVLVKEKSVRYQITPAVFKDVEKKILVRPESKRYEVIPAKFEKKTVDVVKTPDFKRLSFAEAVFKPSKEKIQTKAATAVWKKGDGTPNGVSNMISQVWCLVREAAEYHEYTRQNVATRAKLSTHDVDAEMDHIPTMVMVRPAKVKEIVEPAEYKTVKVRELVTPAVSKEIAIPAEYKMVKRQVLVQQEQVVWERVLCDTNLTPEVIRKIQTALKAKKYDCGKVKGKLTSETKNAISKYQQDHKLSKGAITYEFLDHLKIEL